MEAISALALGVDDLDGSGLLDAASEAERLDRMVQLRKLRIAYEHVCAEAKRLGRLGDTDDYETRKAKALGLIAAGQRHLDLTGETGDAETPRRPVRTNLYVHVSLADLATQAADNQAVGEVERLGPATLDLIRTWLVDSTARILPVLDLNRTDAVDPTSLPTRAGHRVRRTRRTSRHSAGDITGPRPSPAGPTNTPATAAAPGPAPTTGPGSSDPTERRARPRPHPPRRTGSAYTLAT